MTISPALFPTVTVTVVRDRKIRKIRTALRTNQIAGFVTVPSRKKIKDLIFTVGLLLTAVERKSMRNALVPGRRLRKFPASKFN